MNNDAKERLREYVENDDIYTEYKNGKCDMSDFDKYCIEHCKDIDSLLNENEELKEIIDKTITTLVNIDGDLAYGKKSDKICNLIDTLRLVE